ncbi:fimbrial protein [Salmonella enterica]|nr:fimbrial protein [Salmonella enterica]
MNNVMHGKIRRCDGGNTLCRLFRTGLWFSCLALLFFAVLPEFAGATEATSAPTGCTDWDGQGGRSVTLGLPPAVSFETGTVPANGTVLYTSPNWYSIQYQCIKSKENAIHFGGGPVLSLLSDGSALLKQALYNAGLQLQILVNSDGAWTPSESDHTEVGSYSYDNINGYYATDKQTLKLKVQLVVVDSRKIRPGFYAIPSLSSFKLLAFDGAFGSPGVLINTGAVRLQFVPKCFVKTSLSTPDINFGPVITTDVNSSFSLSRGFDVTAGVNESCNGGVENLGNLTGSYKLYLNGNLKGTYYLELPLKVSFVLNNGGRVSSDGKSILLYKEGTTDENGLQLKINAPDDGNPVTFNDTSSPVNKFGEFNGDPDKKTWNIRKEYNAVLSSTGEQVITGKYKAQVTVKVDYY